MSEATFQSFDQDYFQAGLLEGEQIQLSPRVVDPVSVEWDDNGVEFRFYRLGGAVCHRERLATRDFHLNVVLQAEPDLQLNGRWLQDGDGIRYGAGDTQFGIAPPGALIVCVVASRRETRNRAWDLDANEIYSLPREGHRQLLRLSKVWLTDGDRSRSDKRAFAKIVTEALDDGSLRKATRSQIHPRRYRLVTAALDLLDEEDLTRTVEAQRLAGQLGVTRRTLEHAFRMFLGTSPYRFIVLKRLHCVRRDLILLEPRRGLVTEVAMNAGFDNLSRMSRMYRELFGESPRQTMGRRG